VPAGSRELTADTLADTLLVGKNGPQPLPASALVQAVGCLERDGTQNWTLTHAGRLGRTRNGNQIAEPEAAAAAAYPAGTQTIALQNLTELGPAFSPEANQGHKVVVKGAFVQSGAASRVRVLTARSIADACAP
jgi:hypothetical protein